MMITPKQQEFVEELVKTKDLVKAGRKIDMTGNDKVVETKAKTMMQNPYVAEVIKSVADYLPDDLLAAKHLDLLNKIDDDGQMDVQAVSKGLDMAYRIKGSYAAEKRDIVVSGTVNTADPRMIEIAEKYEQELKQTL